MATDIGADLRSDADGVGCGGAALFLSLVAVILVALSVLAYFLLRDHL